MRKDTNGRVESHQLWTPDPKKEPGVELVRVGLSLAPIGTSATDKNSKAILVMSKEAAQSYPLGCFVRIFVEDTQQVLPLARANAGKKRERDLAGTEPH